MSSLVDIDLYPDFLRLRGKTYDYRVTYTQIQRLFLLPKPDDIHSQLVVNIDPPIRQGQTRYPYLVMQFAKDEIMELELSLDEETIQSKYEGNLKQKYDDPAYEVVSLLFRVLTQKKVITPGNFQSYVLLTFRTAASSALETDKIFPAGMTVKQRSSVT
jgi:structure-specific recognition protein 1